MIFRSDKTVTERFRVFLRGSIAVLFAAIMGYFVSRAVFVSYADYIGIEKILAVLFLAAEAFIMFHAFGFFGGMFKLFHHKGDLAVPAFQGEWPDVAVLIPARHEPKEVIERTLATCYGLVYPNKTIYLLDDSTDPRHQQEAQEVADRYNVKVFRRDVRHGAKAGIINDCVKGLKEKYVAVFDADQNPMPLFFQKLIPFLEADPKLAFVQTPQFYSNASTSRVAFGANMQQAVFYEYVCEAKSTTDAMICCGTNVILRREALLDVGGLDENTVTEDFVTSFALHRKGWRSLYYNQVYTFGMGPEDLGSYFKQQARWAMGNVGALNKVLKGMVFDFKSMSLGQWWEYIVTSSYYFVGIAYLFLVVCPLLYLLWNIPSFFMNPVVYGFSFFPYITLSLAVFYTSMLKRGYKASDLFYGQALSFLTVPVYIRSALLGAFGYRGKFAITSKVTQGRVSYLALWPQILFWALNLAAVTWGLNRFYYERSAAVMINTLWAAYHCCILSFVFYYNE